MWFKSRRWIPVAWAISLANLGGLWFAATGGESWHATGHGVLALLFGLGARHLMSRRESEPMTDELRHALDRNEQLEQTIEDLRGQLLELEERVDFSERLLAQPRETERIEAPARRADRPDA